MNPLKEDLITGTTGELLVQLRLFQYGVQAAPPLEDSGNDLIAVRGHTFKAIQIKATRKADKRWRAPRNRLYHILALVRLDGHDNELLLDKSEVYLISRELIENGTFHPRYLTPHRISQELVDRLFPPP